MQCGPCVSGKTLRRRKRSTVCYVLLVSAGYSEDSDYTSDLNYPVGQHANSSASQFRSAAGQLHTPQRSLETSRENSYEREDIPNHHHQHHLPAMPVVTHQHHLSPGYHHHSSGRHHHNSTSSPNHHQVMKICYKMSPIKNDAPKHLQH